MWYAAVPNVVNILIDALHSQNEHAAAAGLWQYIIQMIFNYRRRIEWGSFSYKNKWEPPTMLWNDLSLSDFVHSFDLFKQFLSQIKKSRAYPSSSPNLNLFSDSSPLLNHYHNEFFIHFFFFKIFINPAIFLCLSPAIAAITRNQCGTTLETISFFYNFFLSLFLFNRIVTSTTTWRDFWFYFVNR